MGYLDALKLRLNPGFDILKVNDEENRKLYYTIDKLRKIVYIYFLDPPSKGELSSIEIYYRGKVEPAANEYQVVNPAQTELLYVAPSFSRSTLLYSRSTLWYPAPSDEDYFTAQLKIITPPQYQVVSNGILVEQFELRSLQNLQDVGKAGNLVRIFKSTKPIKYLSFVVGKLSKTGEDQGPIPIQLFRSHRTRVSSWDLVSGARHIINFYQLIFGDYPYEKLDMVKRVHETYGGHSPASFVVLNELPRLLLSSSRRIGSSSPVDLSGWKEYFLAHEIAHQWWGHGVTGKTYADQWLSEGMAQFASILYLKKIYGKEVYSKIIERFSKGVKKKSKWGGITLGSRISQNNFEAYQTIIYNNSAMVLNLLHDLLSED